MRISEHAFSDLLRRPSEVTRDIDQGDVLLQRRGLPALRLTRADREEERIEAYAITARALRNIAVHQPAALIEIIPEVFPWAEFLPRADLNAFVEEFTRVVASTVEFENYGPLIQLVHEWRQTAEIHADPKLARRLRKTVAPSGGEVPRPGS